MLDDSSRRWRLSCFTNTHRRAVFGNSDGTAPWGSPDPAGRKYAWGKAIENGEHIGWRLVEDPDGPAPPMGSDSFGPLPLDL
eukprot:11190564-Alexandrium_andersonii.AAC.1